MGVASTQLSLGRGQLAWPALPKSVSRQLAVLAVARRDAAADRTDRGRVCRNLPQGLVRAGAPPVLVQDLKHRRYAPTLFALSPSLAFSLCGVNCILACDDNTAAEQRLETVSSRLLSTNVHSDDEIDSYEPTPQGDTDTPGLDVHDIVTPEPPPEDGIIFSHSHRRALEGSRSMEYDPSPIETSRLLEKAHISSKHGHGSHHHHHHHHGDVELNNMSMLAKKCAQALLFLLFATYFDLTNRILAVPYCSTHPHHKPAPIAALLLG